ncbi:DUF3825 domain-containing protein [Mollicutes bacterium LVI A0039]|nr:DUF3825 domain-containing protein [Mollicutes bacterium LVI A0039]
MSKYDNGFNKMDEHPPLLTFAYIGTDDVYLKKLAYLAKLAEPENWRYENPNWINKPDRCEFGVLYQYIHHTFTKALEEGGVLETETHAIFNTGLITTMGEEIFMFFEPNKFHESNNRLPKWFFTTFLEESHHEIPHNVRGKLPTHVNYFKDSPQDLYFDPTLTIHGNTRHIVEDGYERIPKLFQSLPKETLITILEGAKTVLQKRILRNNRLAVPQYYNKEVMYLLPLKLGDDIIIPLAVELNEDSYRINTILTNDMAYCNARLVMKPESNWLKTPGDLSK